MNDLPMMTEQERVLTEAVLELGLIARKLDQASETYLCCQEAIQALAQVIQYLHQQKTAAKTQATPDRRQER